MAENENINKVVYGNQTLIDITDTTAEEGSVLQGQVFYKASGARSVGTALTGDINVIESITMNGSSVVPDTNKNIALTETDPTVPSWAKRPTKPTYTAYEVGALADPYVLSGVDTTKSDNGISETVFKNVRFIDENDNAVAHITVQARPDGSTSLSLFTVNYRNQMNYASGIRIVQQKDGTLTYTVNEADAFRDAIGVYSADEIDAMVATLAETKTYLGIS